MKDKSYIIKTQLNITYLIGVFVLLIFSCVFSVIVVKAFGLIGIIGSILLLGFSVAAIINFFKNMRVVYFFDHYLAERYFLKKKITVVPYEDITEMKAERELAELPAFSGNPLIITSAPGDIIILDDRIEILTKDGKKVLLTNTMFDNYEVVNSFVIHNLVKKTEEI